MIGIYVLLYIIAINYNYLVTSIIIFSGLLSSRTRGGWLAFIKSLY